MVNPGAFSGLRKEYLMNQKLTFHAGVTGGYAADALAGIQRRYFKRFPVDLPHDQEPTVHWLAGVNDGAPDPEIEAPDETKLTIEEYIAAVSKMKERRRLIEFRKAQIKRWLAYQYTKDQDMDPKESGLRNPYRILIHKLTGTTSSRPRTKTPLNIWRRTHAAEIDAAYKKVCDGVPRPQRAALREKTAKRIYDKLADAEKEQWAEQAKQEHEEEMARWTEDMEGSLSTAPADRQRCIQGLIRFATPILDMICEATGWKATLLCGGPEPAHGGRLNMLAIHSGMTGGSVPMNFGRAERARYKKYFTPTYGRFLQACYTPQECRARALPADEGFEILETLAADEKDVEYDTFDLEDEVPPPSHPPHDAAASGISTTSASRAETPAHVPDPPPAATPCPSVCQSPACSPAVSPRHSPIPETEPHAAGESNTNAATGGSSNTKDAAPVASTAPPLEHNVDMHSTSSLNNETCSPAPSMSSAPVNSSSAKRPHAAIVNDSSPPSMEPPESNKRPRTDLTNKNAKAGQTGIRARPKRASRAPVASVASSLSTPIVPALPAPIVSTQPIPNVAAPSVPIVTPTSVQSVLSPANAPAPSAVSATSTTTPVASPTPEQPEWFVSALLTLRNCVGEETPLGDEWEGLVRTWMAFEASKSYADAPALKATHRPEAIGHWQKRHRSPVWRPEGLDAKKFGTSFEAWWFVLQPAWRQLKHPTVARSLTTGEWGVLGTKSGKNGLLSVLVALLFWGHAVKKGSKEHRRWSAALADCQTVLSCLCPASA